MILFIGENIDSLSGGGAASRSNLYRLKEECPGEKLVIYSVSNEVHSLSERCFSLMLGTAKPFELIRIVLKEPYRLIWIDRSTFVWLALLFPFCYNSLWRVYMHNDEIRYHKDLATLTNSWSARARVLFLTSYMWLVRLPVIDTYSINPEDRGKFTSVKVWLPLFTDSLSIQSSSHKVVNSSYYLVIGSLFPPNVHGIKWLIENVCTSVDAQFILVGKGLTASRLSLSGVTNVQVLGEVADLHSIIDASIATIAPIWYGSGLKIKVAESIYYGKHCIVTDLAASPFKLILNEHFYEYISTFDSAESLIDILNRRSFQSILPKARYFVE